MAEVLITVVLRDVFDVEYAPIADAIDMSPANARQIARRARDRAGDTTRRRSVDREAHRQLAADHGDVEQLRDLLAADAIQYSDGGGRVVEVRTPTHGAKRIVTFYANVERTGQLPRDLSAQPVMVNGDAGLRISSASRGTYAISAIEVADGRVAIRDFMNPDRFGHL